MANMGRNWSGSVGRRQAGGSWTAPSLSPARASTGHYGRIGTCLTTALALFVIAASGAQADSQETIDRIDEPVATQDLNLSNAFDLTRRTRGVRLDEAALATACVESGATKAQCVCVTRTLRKVIPASDHPSSVLLQTARYSEQPGAMTAARSTLRRQGMSEDEIVATDRQLREALGDRMTGTCSALQISADARSGSEIPPS